MKKTAPKLGKGPCGPCAACGKKYAPDEDGAPGVLYPDCRCVSCPRCGKAFLETAVDGVTIAATDELAEKHDPSDAGACDGCWAHVVEHGRWPKC